MKKIILFMSLIFLTFFAIEPIFSQVIEGKNLVHLANSNLITENSDMLYFSSSTPIENDIRIPVEVPLFKARDYALNITGFAEALTIPLKITVQYNYKTAKVGAFETWSNLPSSEKIINLSEGRANILKPSVKVPERCDKIMLYITFQKGTVGKAYIKNLNFELIQEPLLDAYLLAPIYRGWITKDYPKNIMLRYFSNHEEQGLQSNDLLLSIKIFNNTDGSLATSKTYSVATDGVVSLSNPKILNGDYQGILELATKTDLANPIGSVSFPLKRIEDFPKKGTYIDSHGRLIFEGQPFFLLGIKSNGEFSVENKNIRDVLKAGVNTFFDARYLEELDINDIKKTTEEAGKLNIKTIFSFKSHESDKINPIIEEIRTFNNIIMWNIESDYNFSNIPALNEFYLKLKNLDFERPTLGILSSSDGASRFVKDSDLIGFDFKDVSIFNSNMEAITFSIDNFFKDYGYYYPLINQVSIRDNMSYIEMKNIIWQYLAMSTTGLIISEDLTKENISKNLISILEEISLYKDIFISNEEAPKKLETVFYNMSCFTKTKGVDTYLFAVEISGKKNKINVFTPDKKYKITKDNKILEPDKSGTGYNINLEPFEVAIIKITK